MLLRCCAGWQWRDVECLTFKPHTFAAFKQLPELQQLIAFTAPDILNSRDLASLQIAHVGHMWEAVQQQSETQERLPTTIAELLQAAPFFREAYCISTHKMASELGIAAHLSPHLRLALAAEVAVGMLCPG